MRERKFNSRALRQLAEDVVGQIAADGDIPDDECEDFVTSLVRQWITYDGNATLFVDRQEIYLALGKTPLGKPCIAPAPGHGSWTKQLVQDWKIDPDGLDEIFDQLNRGQSYEVVNRDGIPLRLWVNPKEKARGVESQVKEPILPGWQRDYHKIATTQLEREFGPDLDAAELEALACSVAKQWQQYGGHACLFPSRQERLDFTLRELPEGMCEVVSRNTTVDLESTLFSLGFVLDVIPDVLGRINLGQEVEFRDQQGIVSLLWHDPKTKRLLIRPLDSLPTSAAPAMGPVFCSNCTAVLSPWREGERQQTCPNCGQTTKLY